MKQIISIIVWLFVYSLNAQTLRKMILDLNPNNKISAYYSIVNIRDTLHFIGHGYTNNYSYIHTIFEPASQRVSHHSKEFDKNVIYFCQYNAIPVGNHIVFMAAGVNVGGQNQSVFVKANPQGELKITNFKRMDSASRNDKNNIVMTPDSGFICTGIFRDKDTGLVYPMLYKLDKNGNEIASKSLLTKTYSEARDVGSYEGGITPLSNGSYLVGVQSLDFNCVYSLATYYTEFHIVDTNLNIRSSKKYTRDKVSIKNMKEIAPNKILIYGTLMDTFLCDKAMLQMGRPYIALLDSQYNLQWQIAYNEPGIDSVQYDYYSLWGQINNIRTLQDGNFLAIGSYADTSYYDPKVKYSYNMPMGVLIKFNKNGQILWSRKYRYGDTSIKANGYQFLLQDATELKNKRIVALGTMWYKGNLDTSSIRGWVLILDSVGNIITDTIRLGLESYSSSHSLKLYPNPFTSSLQIDNSSMASQAILYNMEGKEMARFSIKEGKNTLPIDKNIPIGRYIMLFLSPNGDRIKSQIIEKQ